MLPWGTLIASAVGAGGAVVPIYLFGFKQTIESKNALVEQLREQVKDLERQRRRNGGSGKSSLSWRD